MDFPFTSGEQAKYRTGCTAFSGDLKNILKTSFNKGLKINGASLAMLELIGPGQSTKTEHLVSPDELSLRESSLAKVVSNNL